MKLVGTYLVTILLIALLAVFVWGWYVAERTIPEPIFSGVLGLIATLVGYIWLRDRKRQRK